MGPETISDAMLARTFDPGTLVRGRQYAATGRVLTAQVIDDRRRGGGLKVISTVSGTARLPYGVVIHIEDDSLRATCNCPVGQNCKHAVAVLEHLRLQAAPAPVPTEPQWRVSLDSLLDKLEETAPVAVERKRLALQFELPFPTRRRWRAHPGAGQHLWLRPMRQGARDNWIKTGINWHVAETPQYDLEHDLDQLAVLTRIVRAFPNGVARDVVDLTAIGPQLPQLLDDARDAGIPLLGGERVSSVEVADEPLDLVADIVDGDEGPQLRLGVWHEDRFVNGEDLHLLGRQPHTVGLVAPVRASTTATHPKVRLLLAPLVRRLPESVTALHQRGGAIDVPRRDRKTFESDYLPRLRQQLPVSSSDGSMTLPDEVPPRLQVVIAWSGLDADVEWRWVYGEAIFAIDSRDRAPAVRRPALEQRLRLAAGEWPHLMPRAVISDLDAVFFVEDDLPELLAHDSVEVIETGVRPDFRAAVGTPTIEFQTVEDEAKEASTDWLDLRVVISVDGESVPLSDVLTALTAGQPRIVLPGGLHLSTDRPEFRRLAELVAAAAEIRDGREDGLSVAHRDLGVWAELAELGLVDHQAAKWVEAAQALIGHATLPEVAPVGLVSELRGYQHDGVRWLVHLWSLGLGGILADDMGLGKTVQTLAMISHARAHGAAPFLVVAPTSVMTAWASEAARHTPGLTVRVIDASAARRTASFEEATREADIVVTSYTLFRLEADAYTSRRWGGLILDEAQAIKNHHGKTYQAVRLLDVPFRLAVTGTPFENRLMELWSLLSVVAPGLYPWPKKFAEQVAKPVEKQGDQVALDRFRSRIRPFILRRTKELVASDLPAKQEQVLEVVLGDKHQLLYDTWLQKERQSILGLVDDFDKNRVAIFTALTRLRQLSLDPALVDEEHEGIGSAKLDVLIEHLVELAAEGHRALVFSQFTSFLKRARTRLEAEGLTWRYLDGATRNRGAEIDAFKSGDGDAFLISLKAGGVGLTLTEADYVFVLDPWWNPAAEDQAVDRAHRIGQTKHVMVYRLVATQTIEEKVMALKERKAALFASVFSGEGAVGAGIDADDVRSLFE